MEKNCLVTKLKAVVDNPNLVKLGHIILDCRSESNKYVAIVAGADANPLYVTLLSGVIESVTSGVTLVDSTHCIVQPGAGATGFRTHEAGQEIKLDIKDYYGLTQIPLIVGPNGLTQLKYTSVASIDLRNPTKELDIEDLSSLTQCTSMEIRDSNQKIIGDLGFIRNFPLTNFVYLNIPVTTLVKLRATDFASITTLQTLILENNKISTLSDNIAQAFGTLTNLTTLRLAGTAIYGSVEAFVAAQRNAGRLTCNGIAVGVSMGNVTFNGSSTTGPSSQQLSWTANTITLNNVTINA